MPDRDIGSYLSEEKAIGFFWNLYVMDSLIVFNTKEVFTKFILMITTVIEKKSLKPDWGLFCSLRDMRSPSVNGMR